MEIEQDIEVYYKLVSLQYFIQQLLPAPYETMCRQQPSTRTSCLDRCLPMMLNTEGRLVAYTNSTLFQSNIQGKLITEQCSKICSKRACIESFYSPVISEYFMGHFSAIRMILAERKLITTPKMNFEEFLINQLNVLGIWLGLSISNCITFVINGHNWIDNQRIP